MLATKNEQEFWRDRAGGFVHESREQHAVHGNAHVETRLVE